MYGPGRRMGRQLVGHLVSEDFFHVDEYATSFMLRDITPLSTTDGAASHNVVGDFTIRGITQSVSFLQPLLNKRV